MWEGNAPGTGQVDLKLDLQPVPGFYVNEADECSWQFGRAWALMGVMSWKLSSIVWETGESIIFLEYISNESA